jgi:long-subunit fatty acid transport protein
MKTKTIIAAGLAAASAGAAFAGGIDRSGQSMAPLFEKGTYAEFSLGYVSPNVSGTQVQTLSAASTAGAKSGDMAGSYSMPGFAFKKDFNSHVAAAVIYDQPFGASVNYPVATALPAYFNNGAIAKLSTNALTGVVKYRFDNNMSLYGGLRWQTMREHVAVPAVSNAYGGYDATGANQGAFGYVLGAAYEKPDIGLRVALTYNSKIKYNVPTKEYFGTTQVGQSTTPITTPQSIDLDVQTGINPTTLVFGSIRWANWKQFEIAPTVYKTATGEALVALHGNTISYTLGVGHKFTDRWSGAVTVGYEPKVGGFASNLAPTDGHASIGLGATYTMGNMKITGGVSYVRIGSAQTTADNVNPVANFSSNHAIAAGMKVGWTF